MYISLTNDIKNIRELVAMGDCPVECSIGGGSIVDSLQMDHHGTLSRLEGVALRAYRDHFGARRVTPDFVLVGTADAAFAIAALAGVLPHPSRATEFEKAPPPVKAAMTRDWTRLAALVNRVDTDPIGLDLASEEYGPYLLVFNALNAEACDDLGALGAVALWRNLLSGKPGQAAILQGARNSEAERRSAAQRDWDERGSTYGRVGIVEHSRAWGFDVWYGRDDRAAPDMPIGWKRPVIIALVESRSNITIGCPNVEVAEALFGPGGLKNVYPRLDVLRAGWGAREAVGGSPRGEKMSASDLKVVAQIVHGSMKA